MVLRNLLPVDGDKRIDIFLNGGRITTLGAVPQNTGHEIVFKDAIVFPGLINSHDHLDFNLYPQLGNRVYDNYVQWGADIQATNKQVIQDVLAIPLALRVRWGMYKNLINGITTVVNHGVKLDTGDDLISVFQSCYNLHSVGLEKGWKYKLNSPIKKRWPFVIHTGEGSDDSSHEEIDNLIRWNLLNRKLVGVHGIAMNERQAEAFRALVWCPASNQFLIGSTAPVNRLKSRTRMLFGTDSTVSANWNLWEHLAYARSTKMATDKELFAMLTQQPATVWRLKKTGQLKVTYDADIVVARQKDNLTSYNAFYATGPGDILLVMHKGEVKLVDQSIASQIFANDQLKEKYSQITIEGSTKYIYGDLPGLMAAVKQYYPAAAFPIGSIAK